MMTFSRGDMKTSCANISCKKHDPMKSRPGGKIRSGLDFMETKENFASLYSAPGGTSTSRLPLLAIADRIPAASICSTSRAARL
jgi:hypothetical protein